MNRRRRIEKKGMSKNEHTNNPNPTFKHDSMSGKGITIAS
jgi:hypothetical protein